ncbi:VOC family protein [Demequina sp. TTPB684]|uniref:VOC family protein n=1 Tax=unclassified Demequina TaxID=2620311 RepID=UPI001CF4C997|nr:MULTISPECIES: VOC family protein [unclassified Demequina]MCB2412993.1 VOC family protein [Demequina sp. TTPB684]UPU87062.1 VOC family protein [Demequina sp. TMPB413]
MLGSSEAIGTFSTDSVERAVPFYRDVLGIDASVVDAGAPILNLRFKNGATFMIYEKEDHVPASHTVMMFPVADVGETARRLAEAGVSLEATSFTDDDGVARDPSGQMPQVAWFKDPAGNWLSILEAGA